MRTATARSRASLRAEVTAGTDEGVHVELGAVQLPAGDLAPWPQRLELTPHRLDPPPRRHIRCPGFTRTGIIGNAGKNPAVVRKVGLGAVIPLGIDETSRELFPIDVRWRKIQVELQFRRRPALCLYQRDFVMVIGGPLRGIFVLVINAPVDPKEFRP